MRPFADLRGVHTGQPIAVLGGGPSLPGDMVLLPADAVLIGVNHHASRFVDVDYMAFLDRPQAIPDLRACVAENAGRRITPLAGYSDWDLSGVEFWDGGMTSTFTTWVACYMGGAPVLLCGMDCFQGAEKYCHDRDMPDHPAHHYPIENHLKAWRKALGHCERSEVIRAVSGPLVNVFGRWEER